MAQDQVTLYNLALSAVGTRARVNSVTENTREAEICNRWYPLVRDTALRAANWASCRAVARLALNRMASSDTDWVEGDPEPGWTYRYALPVDYLYPRFLSDYSNFVLCAYQGATMLQTNAEYPVLIYTRKEENCGAWDPDLFKAVALGLAASISMPLNGKADRANVAIQDANTLIVRARENMANENVEVQDSLPDWLLARGAAIGQVYNKYIFQSGPLFSQGLLI